MSIPDIGLELFDLWSSEEHLLQPESFGLWLMDNDWWKDVGWELDILVRLHVIAPIRSVYVASSKLGVRPSLPMQANHPALQKVANLVDAVESTAKVGDPQGVLDECEHFAKYKGQWLKVAGLEKAEIIEASFQPPSMSAAQFVVEFGVFVGYTAVRLSSMVGRVRRHMGVASLEVSPVHVCVARHIIDIAELAHIGEVKAGQAKDVLPRVGEELGLLGMIFAFMDHRGTIFHQDYTLVEKDSFFAPGARFVTDNTLNPGSPVFLWERGKRHGHGCAAPTQTRAWSITEFMSDHEDWMAVSCRK